MVIEPGVSDKLFCYGTLAFPQVMRAVTGSDYPRRDAVLNGYARYRVRGETFPGIVAQARAEVRGVLYRGIEATALRLIDVFENDCYARRLVDVEQPDGGKVTAWAYAVPPALRERLTRTDWDAESFARHHLSAWLRALGT